MWALRENISEAQAAEGKNIKHDVSVPISAIAEFVEHTNADLTTRFPGVRMVVFGHLGDGNLHYNMTRPVDWADDAFARETAAISAVVHDLVHDFHGSISAEHGLGQVKRDEAARYKTEVELDLMRAVKRALDPRNLMNPGKVLRLE